LDESETEARSNQMERVLKSVDFPSTYFESCKSAIALYAKEPLEVRERTLVRLIENGIPAPFAAAFVEYFGREELMGRVLKGLEPSNPHRVYYAKTIMEIAHRMTAKAKSLADLQHDYDAFCTYFDPWPQEKKDELGQFILNVIPKPTDWDLDTTCQRLASIIPVLGQNCMQRCINEAPYRDSAGDYYRLTINKMLITPFSKRFSQILQNEAYLEKFLALVNPEGESPATLIPYFVENFINGLRSPFRERALEKLVELARDRRANRYTALIREFGLLPFKPPSAFEAYNYCLKYNDRLNRRPGAQSYDLKKTVEDYDISHGLCHRPPVSRDTVATLRSDHDAVHSHDSHFH
jgi:hypothetical protein